MNAADFEKLIQKSTELSAHKDFFLSIAKPSVVINVTKQGPNPFESQFGGKPLLPKGFTWPKHSVGEYRFLGHINFSEIADHQTELPTSGLLSLFYAQDDEGEVFWGEEGYIKGYFWPDVSLLEAMEPPYKKYRRAKRIQFEVGVDIPRHEELRANWPFDVELLDYFMDTLPEDYLLGYPSHCSLAYDPTPGKEWCSLLTLSSLDEFDWSWHDGDKLMVFIEKDKLVTKDFSLLKADAG